MNINEYIRQLESKHNIRVIYLTKSGSNLYGTATADSDVDYKGIFVSTVNNMLLKNDLPHVSFTSGENDSKNSADDVDIHLDSISTFVRLLAKGETGSIDLLFSMFDNSTTIIDDDASNGNVCNTIMDNYTNFYGKNLQAFVGYCVGQSKKYNIKGARYNELVSLNGDIGVYTSLYGDARSTHLYDWLERNNLPDYKYIKLIMAPGPKSAKSSEHIQYLEVLGKKFSRQVGNDYLKDKLQAMEDQFGNRARSAVDNVDWKSLSHAVRVIYEVEELLITNFIKFPLAHRQQLLDIRQGKYELDTIINIIEHKVALIDELMESTNIQESADTVWTNQFLLATIKGQ